MTTQTVGHDATVAGRSMIEVFHNAKLLATFAEEIKANTWAREQSEFNAGKFFVEFPDGGLTDGSLTDIWENGEVVTPY